MRRHLAIMAVLAAGCAAPPREAPPAVSPCRPARFGAPAETWEVASSRLEIRVYRDGPMQRLGHNHVIVSEALGGTIRLRQPLVESGFVLALPLDSLVLDDSVARGQAGSDFAAPVPPKDREATRRNMLGEQVLDAARQDVVCLVTEALSAAPGALEARVRVSLRGEEHVVTVPFTIEIEGASLTAQAGFELTHGALGLAPFTVALGALRVRDDIEFHLRLEARRAS